MITRPLHMLLHRDSHPVLFIEAEGHVVDTLLHINKCILDLGHIKKNRFNWTEVVWEHFIVSIVNLT